MKRVRFEIKGQVSEMGHVSSAMGMAKRVNTAELVEPWYGVGLANVDAPPEAQPDMGVLGTTRVATPDGSCRVDELQVGDLVEDYQGTPTKVASVTIAAPTTNAILLRAPYFGLDQDLIIGQNHRLVMSNEAAEALFGEETVLMPVWALKDGKRAKFVELSRRERLYEVKLDNNNAMRVGACAVASKERLGATPIAQPLSDAEARGFSTVYRDGFFNTYS